MSLHARRPNCWLTLRPYPTSDLDDCLNEVGLPPTRVPGFTGVMVNKFGREPKHVGCVYDAERMAGWTMNGEKPYDQKNKDTPIARLFADDLSDPDNTLPEKLLAIEEGLDDFCGKKTRMQASISTTNGMITSRKDPIRDSPDFMQCMAEIMQAAAK
jgi:hypothetical protein